jgi:hypothetical protein
MRSRPTLVAALATASPPLAGPPAGRAEARGTSDYRVFTPQGRYFLVSIAASF